MSSRPSVVVFDVNETLSDMRPMARRFEDVGAPEHLAKLWFAMVLRAGFALAAARSQQPFAQVAAGALRTLVSGVDLERDLDAAVEHITTGFSELPVHDDVPGSVRGLRDAGLSLVTLSNGSTRVADQLLTRAGIRDCSTGSCPSRTRRRGNRLGTPTSTPPEPAGRNSTTWCSSPSTPGTSTGPAAPAWTPCGSIATAPPIPTTSPRPRTPSDP